MENKIFNSNEINKNDNSIIPPNILIKLSSSNKLQLLSQKDRGIIFTNIYHYHLGMELMEMTPIGSMFFMDLVEVFDFNKEKYKEIVLRNQNNGRKNKKKSPETQENPVGSFGMPNQTKDIDKNKSIERVIEKNIVTKIDSNKDLVIDESRVKDNQKVNSKEIEKELHKIYETDPDQISDGQEKIFCQSVIQLVDILGWHRFIYLYFINDKTSIIEALREYEHPELEYAIFAALNMADNCIPRTKNNSQLKSE